MFWKTNDRLRRLVALLLALSLVGGSTGELLTAAAEEGTLSLTQAVEEQEEAAADLLEETPVEIIEEEPSAEENEVEEVPAEAVVEEDLPAEEAVVEEAPVETVVEELPVRETEVVEAAVEEPVKKKLLPSKGTITGFGELTDGMELTVGKEALPTVKELTAEMPQTLPVYLDLSEETVELPVSWYCVSGDFEDGTQYYYQFSPKWDTKKYPLTQGLEAEMDAPCVGVFLTEGSGLVTQRVTRSSNETTIYRFLVKEMELNCAAACGVMANVQSESGFRPGAVNPGSPSFHGLCQWGLGGATGSRWSKLKKWCKSHGYSSGSVNGQLRYMKYELENIKAYRYSSLKSVSNTAAGASSAARTFARYFEGCSSRYFSPRQRLAKGKYWKEYSPLALCKVSLEGAAPFYNGMPQLPALKVTSGTRVLQQGEDYTVRYDDNVLSGTASFQISGIGKYSGLLLGSFVIRTEAPVLSKAQSVANGVKVSWKAAVGAAHYRLYRRSGSKWVKVTDTASLSAVDTGAVSGQKNTYIVRCIGSNGESVSDCSAKSISLDYVAAPALTVKVADGGVKVSWKAVKGATHYRVLKKNAKGTWEEVKLTKGTSFVDKKVSMGKANTYCAVSLEEQIVQPVVPAPVEEETEEAEEEVQEVLQKQEPQPATQLVERSSRSAAVSIRVLPTPVLKAAKGVNRGIQLSWKKVTGAAKYRIYRKKNGKWVKVAETTSTTWKDKSVKKKTKYTYTVACISKDGKTLESAVDTKGVTGERKR